MSTPRTDAEAFEFTDASEEHCMEHIEHNTQGYLVHASFARQLETELAAAKDKLAEIEKAASPPVGLSARELQSLRNIGNEAESAADEIENLRAHALHLGYEIEIQRKYAKKGWDAYHAARKGKA